MRLVFGNPNSTGFVAWDWIKENDGSTQFAPGSALYAVDTSNWNSATLTNAGKLWQDQLGIHDWDGNPANGWNTQLSATVGPDGKVNFNGFYGDYEISVGGKTFDLALAKGISNYVLNDSNVLEGDFNHDGRVDAADYTVWRDGPADPVSYQIWKTNFGRSLSGSSALASVPEPSSVVVASPTLLLRWRRRARRKDRFDTIA